MGVTALLEIQGLTKYFGGLAAVDILDFHVKEGEIVGLIGPNGAGKTTVFNLITGIIRPTAGQVMFDGRVITGTKPHVVARLGIGRTFQLNPTFRRLFGAAKCDSLVLPSPEIEVARRLFQHLGLQAQRTSDY